MVACGTAEQPAETGIQPSTGTPTAGAAAGPAVAPGAGAAGGGAVTSVMCGAMTCSNPAVSILSTVKMFMPSAMLATPCCLADGGCGWVGAAGECTPPPNKASCPAPSVPLPGVTLTGCCIESSQTCGIDSSALGMGCAANMFGGGARTNCDGTSAAPPAGAAGGPATGAAGGGAAAGAPATGAAGGGAAGTAAAAGAGAATAGNGAAGMGAATAGTSATAGSAATAGRGGSTATSAGAGGR
jgi:hypothetical protein